MNIPPPKGCRAPYNSRACVHGALYNERMKYFLAALLFLAVLPVSAPSAQIMGEITSKPVCGQLINRAGQTMMGSIATAEQRIDSGDLVSHSQNFRLEDGEKWDICARGPFYTGQRLELTIRTLIPLFSCKTKIDQPVYLESHINEYGIKKLSATCH